MTPQEHYERAEWLLEQLEAANSDADPAIHTALCTEAQVHATLALAGFTRDLDAGIVADVAREVAIKRLGGDT